jgi:hypothetical protein
VRGRSGQIDLHEFIRFSLRDALARAAARVMDLLHEWDEDGSGTIDRKEFRRAIKALGFHALADNEDIDLVFDECVPRTSVPRELTVTFHGAVGDECSGARIQHTTPQHHLRCDRSVPCAQV